MLGRIRPRDIVATGAATLVALFAWCPPAFALDPTLDISQYAHTAWRIRDGLAPSRITVFAQTPEGYLWLGTETGLFRFDGVKVEPWRPPNGGSLPSLFVRSLLSGRDGTLWIGTTSGLVAWKDRTLTPYPQLASVSVDALLETSTGTVWAAGSRVPTGQLCAIRGVRPECHGHDGSFGRFITSLHESGGQLWIAAEKGLWRWAPGTPVLHLMRDRPSGHLQSLADDGTGALLVDTRDGVRRFADGTESRVPLPGLKPGTASNCVFLDRHGGVWIGTDAGLFHMHQGRVDVFTRADGSRATS